jgi:hypothetical protein
MSKRKQQVEVTMLWGDLVLNIEYSDGQSPILIGHQQTVHFFVPEHGIPEKFILIEKKAGQFFLNLAPWMKVNLGVANEKHAYALKPKDCIFLKIGKIEFKIRMLVTPNLTVETSHEYRDLTYFNIFAVVCLLFMALIAWVLRIPNQVKMIESNLKDSVIFHEMVVSNQKKPVKMVKPLPSEKAEKNVSQVKLEKTMQLFKQLGLTSAGSKSKVLSGDFQQSLNGLRGQQLGAISGDHVQSTRNMAIGKGEQAVGISKIGSGTGRGIEGAGDLSFGGTEKERARIESETVTYEGSLTKEEIQRVVDRFMAQIKYCYEHEFQRAPSLAGKVVANWVISAEGNVETVRVKQNTMGSIPVESCVLRVINRMVFPKPRGGGIVTVSFPFVFTSAGA